MTPDRGTPPLPDTTHIPRHCSPCNRSSLLMQGTGHHGRHHQFVYLTLPVTIDGLGGRALGEEVVRHPRRWRTQLLCRYKSLAGQSAGGAGHKLGGSRESTLSLGFFLPGLPGKRGRTPHYIQGMQPHQRKFLRGGEDLGADTVAAVITCRPPRPPPDRI